MEGLVDGRAIGDKDFSIKRWPVKYDHAREALKAMKETHRINCPPIWDTKLDLAMKIVGAVVLEDGISRVRRQVYIHVLYNCLLLCCSRYCKYT